jgi:hypothetical protein
MCEAIAKGATVKEALISSGLLEWNAAGLEIGTNPESKALYNSAMTAREAIWREEALAKIRDVAINGKRTVRKDSTGFESETISDDPQTIIAQAQAYDPARYAKQSGPLVVHNSLTVNTNGRATLADLIASSTDRAGLLSTDREKVRAQVIDI